MNLNQIMTQIRGLSYSKKDSNNNSFKGAIPVLRAGNIQDSKIIEEDYVYVPNDLVKNKQYLKHGDVLIAASSGSISIVGKAAMIEYDMNATFGAFCKVLRPNSEKIYIRYFKHFFETDYYKRTIKSLAEGANINNLKTEHFDDLEIPLPPLDQQKKIASILDAADACRQKTKALIEKYDELTQSLFMDMFGDPVTNPKGWGTTTIKEVCTLQGGYSFKSKDFVNEGVKLVKIANVHFEDMVWDEVDLLPSDFLDKYSKFSLNEGDILMALTRPIIKSLGTVKAITVDQSDLPCLLNQRVARFIPNEKRLHKSYLLRYIYGSYFKNKIKRYSSTSLQPNVSNKQIEEIEIMLPPINLQNQFAERVQAIEAQKAQAQASLAQAEDLFNSLLQRAFKGELTS
jgi:type I restriction enzyme S subunit